VGSTLESLKQHIMTALNMAAVGKVPGLRDVLESAFRIAGDLEGEHPLLDEALKALNDTLATAKIPDRLSPPLSESAELNDLLATVAAIHAAILSLANGDLSVSLKARGGVAGAIKALHANLRHLTWQTQRIASGDFSYRVDFMGEFSEAFNAMVMSLEEARTGLQQSRAELAERNAELLHEIAERKKAEDAYRELSIRDPLTELFNRRHFFYLAEQELERSRRYRRPLSAVMLDIDHFKTVNDRFGHATGDLALIAVADDIRHSLRKVDLAGRYGGEEFAMLLPEADPPNALAAAERLRSQIASRIIPTEKGELKFTVSLGISSTGHGEAKTTIDILFERADQALYKAKESGRNRTVAHSD
jgi:diguanylate cyclase (GGDEF)-like protein